MSIRTTVLGLKARELAWGNCSVDYKNYNCPYPRSSLRLYIFLWLEVEDLNW